MAGTTDLEERVRILEAYRVAASGRINALQVMLLSLLANGLVRTEDARGLVDRLRETWSAQAGGEAYDEAVADLCRHLDKILDAHERRKN